MSKIPLLFIVGPTASGKTSLSIELGKIYNGEIISADSMQIYNGMDISTAKPSLEERQGIPHHLMGFLDITSDFSVAEYLKLAREKINDVYSRGKLPIVVGGTGLYISSLVDNIQFDETACNSEIRQRLTDEMNSYGSQFMLDKLTEIDEDTALSLHPNNKSRIIRALEYYEITGIKLSVQKELSRKYESPYNSLIIGINYADRQKLYDRINLRVDLMINEGLIEESLEIYNKYNLKTSCQAIGYKELIPYFKGEIPLDTCVQNIKQQTRRYAKRQLTWFRRDSRINWIYLDTLKYNENIIDICKKVIAKSNIL